MPFEVFQGQRVRVTDEPTVTLQKRGTISLNLSAHEALGSPDKVELLYDREQRLIGIRKAADPSSQSAYNIRPVSQRGTKPAPSYIVSGKAFTVYYDIPTDSARRWTAHVEDEMLIVDLKEPGMQVTSNRTRNGGDQQRERSLFAS